MPITTTNGGINAVNKVILYPNKTIVPKLHITPIATTARLINVAANERKKSNKTSADKANEPKRK